MPTGADHFNVSPPAPQLDSAGRKIEVLRIERGANGKGVVALQLTP